MGGHPPAPRLVEPVAPLAFAVAVPARDEATRVGRCLDALRRAADECQTSVVVVVACDGCTDGTARRVSLAAADDPRIRMIEGDWGSAGAARRAAARIALDQLDVDHRATWLLSTDADTVVPPTWFRSIESAAADGVEAMAGLVDLSRDDDWSSVVETAFAVGYPIAADTHGHVHAANLAVRRDAYERVGGFPPIACGEDHAVWTTLQQTGHRCLSSIAWRVATSARLRGRAAGGFADTLALRLTSAAAAGS